MWTTQLTAIDRETHKALEKDGSDELTVSWITNQSATLGIVWQLGMDHLIAHGRVVPRRLMLESNGSQNTRTEQVLSDCVFGEPSMFVYFEWRERNHLFWERRD